MSSESFEEALPDEGPRQKVWKRTQYSKTRQRRKRFLKRIGWVFVAAGSIFATYNLIKIFQDPRWIEPPAKLPVVEEKAR